MDQDKIHTGRIDLRDGLFEMRREGRNPLLLVSGNSNGESDIRATRAKTVRIGLPVRLE